MLRSNVGLFALRCAMGMAASNALSAAYALTITPVFDDSITSSPNASSIENAINSALPFYQQNFTNPGNVQILFKMSSRLGGEAAQSVIAYQLTRYSEYVSLLSADASANPNNTVLATALDNLSVGNQANAIQVTNADLSALGYTGTLTGLGSDGSIGGGNYAGVISFNSNLPLVFNGAVGSQQFDAVSLAQHEINEILGVGGAGSSLNGVAYNNTIRPLDMYRYAAPRTPSLTTSPSAYAYFSFDGGSTNLAAFNQSPQGDYGDWASANQCLAQVGAAFACAGQSVRMSVDAVESVTLEAVGYNLATELTVVPEAEGRVGMAIGVALVMANAASQAYQRRWVNRAGQRIGPNVLT